MGNEEERSAPTVSRRSFVLRAVIGVFTSLGALVMAVPFLRVVFNAAPLRKAEWAEAANISILPEGQPKDVKFEAHSVDAYLRQMKLRSVWVIKHSPEIFSVFSPICPHLGCYYKWDPSTQHFECPCHGSVFTITGKVIGGPAPRPLDTLPYKVQGGKLFVKWERFQVGIPQKVRV